MEKKVLKVINWIRDYWEEILGFVVAPILLAIPSIFKIHIILIWVFIFVAAALLFISIVNTFNKRERVTELNRELFILKEKNKSLENRISDFGINNFQLFSQLLSIIFRNLPFTNEERVSIYKINSFDEEFNIIGRHSSSYILKKLGRRSYPIREGYLGKVISQGNGYFFTDNYLPAYTNGNKQEYYNRLSDHGVTFDKNTLKNMCMVSRAYLCKVLYNHNNNPIAVIVVESKREGILSQLEEEIVELIDNHSTLLVEHCERSIIITPDPNYAKLIGF